MKQNLHTPLEALSDRIDNTRAHLQERAAWHDTHHLSAGEFKARHAYLQDELDKEIVDLETHGHHVSRLERSVREWLYGLEL